MNDQQKIKYIGDILFRRRIENAMLSESKLLSMSTYDLEKLLETLKQGTSGQKGQP